MPMYLAWMRASLWLDGAWVANSVLEPSWGEMFRYETLPQTSPSLSRAYAGSDAGSRRSRAGKRLWMPPARASALTLEHVLSGPEAIPCSLEWE